jgi:hypothetical protein
MVKACDVQESTGFTSPPAHASSGFRPAGEIIDRLIRSVAMPLRQNKNQVSPLRLKITLLVAGFGPVIAIGLWLQSKGFFS